MRPSSLDIANEEICKQYFHDKILQRRKKSFQTSSSVNGSFHDPTLVHSDPPSSTNCILAQIHPHSYSRSTRNEILLKSTSNDFSSAARKILGESCVAKGRAQGWRKNYGKGGGLQGERSARVEPLGRERGWRAHALGRHLQPLILAYKLENVLSRLREALPRDDTVFRRAARYLLAPNDH